MENKILLLSILIFFLLTSFYFLYMSFFLKRNSKKNIVENSIFGLIVIIFSFYPYYIFGELSPIGFFDEADSNIPIELSINKKINQNNFIHNYFGGTVFKYILPNNNVFISYIQIFLKLFDPFFATLLVRIIGVWFFFTLFLVIFYEIIERKFINYNFKYNNFLAFLGGMSVIFGIHVTYLYSFGGLGWSIIFSIFYIYFLCKKINQYLKLIVLILVSLIISSSISIFFFFGTIIFVFFCYVFLLELNSKKTIKENYKVIIFTFLIAIINSINSILDLTSILKESSTFASLKESCNLYIIDFNYLTISEFKKSLIEQVKVIFQGYDLFLKFNFVNGKNYPFNFIFLLSSLFFSIWSKIVLKKNNFLIIFFISFILPIILSSLCIFLCLPLICRFRWELIYQYTFIFHSLIIIIGILLVREYYELRIINFLLFFYFIFLLFIIYLGAANMQLRILSELNFGSNWKTLLDRTNYLPNNYDKNFRTLSLNDVPKSSFLSYQRIYTADGTRFNYGWRYNFFWKYNLLDNISVRHKVRSTLAGIDYLSVSSSILDSSRILNVKYIYSQKQIDNINFKLNKKIQGIKVKDLNSFVTKLKFISDIVLIPDIFIYEIEDSWHRVFIPSEIFLSEYSDSSVQYFYDLKKLKKNSIMIPQNLSNLTPTISEKILRNSAKIFYEELEDGIQIKNISYPIVYNQEFSKKWMAKCDEEYLNIFPINGYMIFVNPLKKCGILKIFIK